MDSKWYHKTSQILCFSELFYGSHPDQINQVSISGQCWSDPNALSLALLMIIKMYETNLLLSKECIFSCALDPVSSKFLAITKTSFDRKESETERRDPAV